MSADYFIRKLSAFATLSDEGQSAIWKLAKRPRQSHPREDLVCEGANPKDVHLILNGWACRYKMLEDGRRQILGLLLPGDLCDLNIYILDKLDHCIGTLTPVEYARISPNQIEALCDDYPRVARALWWESLVSASIQREWLVNAAQRTPLEALAHLFCEIYLRLRLIGLADNGQTFDFPLVQHDMADAIGVTQPQISRLVRQLDDSGIATLRARKLIIKDASRLRELAGFNPGYLHFR